MIDAKRDSTGKRDRGGRWGFPYLLVQAGLILAAFLLPAEGGEPPYKTRGKMIAYSGARVGLPRQNHLALVEFHFEVSPKGRFAEGDLLEFEFPNVRLVREDLRAGMNVPGLLIPIPLEKSPRRRSSSLPTYLVKLKGREERLGIQCEKNVQLPIVSAECSLLILTSRPDTGRLIHRGLTRFLNLTNQKTGRISRSRAGTTFFLHASRVGATLIRPQELDPSPLFLKFFDVVVLEGDGHGISPEGIRSLKRWALGGGKVVAFPSPKGETPGPLADWLPGEITGRGKVDAQQIFGPDAPPGRIDFLDLRPRGGEVPVGFVAKRNLLLGRGFGLGEVYRFAAPPRMAEKLPWDRALKRNRSRLNPTSFQFKEVSSMSPGWLALFLAVYVVFVGPLAGVLAKRWGRIGLRWGFAGGAIAVFSLLALGVGGVYYAKHSMVGARSVAVFRSGMNHGDEWGGVRLIRPLRKRPALRFSGGRRWLAGGCPAAWIWDKDGKERFELEFTRPDCEVQFIGEVPFPAGLEIEKQDGSIRVRNRGSWDFRRAFLLREGERLDLGPLPGGGEAMGGDAIDIGQLMKTGCLNPWWDACDRAMHSLRSFAGRSFFLGVGTAGGEPRTEVEGFETVHPEETLVIVEIAE
ncbi:MAG: hypothetical protein ACYTHN_06990 [Planctomycetota bacterium]